jgi:hypothetical protein
VGLTTCGGAHNLAGAVFGVRSDSTNGEAYEPPHERGGEAVIVDLRIYTIKPSGIPTWLAYYKDHGWPLQQEHLQNCLGWFSVKEGRQDQLIHLWAYQDQADRERRRDALYADPRWQAYVRGVWEMDLMVSLENRFLTPTDFSPLPTLEPLALN